DPGELPESWLKRLQAQQAELRRYEYSPLEQVQKWSGLPAGAWDRSSVHELFAAQVARSPEAAAVIWDGRVLSYGELDRRASGVARRLVELGVGPETVVGLCAERCFGMLEGMLGILMAGGIYLPLDPGSPRERLAFMLEDSGTRVLVTVGAARDLPAGGRPVVSVAAAAEAVGGRLPRRWVSPEQGAYVIYTSGSTGRPKGVLVSHRSLASYAVRAADAYGIEPGDRALQFASLSFDASAEEIYPTLVRGAALVLRSDELAPAPEFLDECRAGGITVLNLPTAYWHTLMADAGEGGAWPECLRVVIIGGEEALPDALDSWQRRVGDGVRLVNTYGPTEATIVATRWQPGAQSAAREQLARVPIGRPAAGARTYVLDGRLGLVPVGVPGELTLGGDGLARGYPQRPGLTAERFVPDPLSGDPFGSPGGRLYATGDRACWRDDGHLEFLGRIDRQVKIRGFRIEPGEIETVLAEHPAVAAAVVTVRKREGARSGESGPALVAWVVGAAAEPQGSELRTFLTTRLPNYMVPAVFVPLDSLPLTPSGKVDRAALARRALPDRAAAADAIVPPGTPAEVSLARIGSRVLGVERVGVNDNFFELGGDSILSIQVVSGARQEGLLLTARDVFRQPTLGELAAVVAAATEGLSDQGPVTGELPLTPIQRWFFEWRLGAPHHFNQALLLETRERLEPASLERALAVLLEHHDALRLRFRRAGDRWRQV
ncbi:MAG: amino acid adenylation domain-containing protein, partial [bacterium]|nr:amino acid adenylation domain-containing protein [bacterium]